MRLSSERGGVFSLGPGAVVCTMDLVHYACFCSVSAGAPPDVTTPGPRLPLLARLYAEHCAQPNSQGYAGAVAKHYSPGGLERLAAHPSREIRRAAVLALGLLGDYEANLTMGRALTDEDRLVRTHAENTIRTIWVRAGSPTQQQRLTLICRLIAARMFTDAIQQATRLIDEAPYYAEAWNQRAIAHFSLRRFSEAIYDCHQTLEINPYHFGAASGMGQAYLELGDRSAALETFRRALRLNPGLEGVRVQVARLSKLVGGA